MHKELKVHMVKRDAAAMQCSLNSGLQLCTDVSVA